MPAWKSLVTLLALAGGVVLVAVGLWMLAPAAELVLAGVVVVVVVADLRGAL